MKRNVLFLDFDGPLTNARSFVAYDRPFGRMMWTTADPVAVAMLNTLHNDYNFVTVVSSTWRKFTDMNPTGVDAKESLRLWGYKGDFHDDWATPDRSNVGRNQEIKSWLVEHQDEVDNWASLDDILLKKWTNNAHVDENDGMSYENYKHLRNMFSGGGWRMPEFLEKLDKLNG